MSQKYGQVHRQAQEEAGLGWDGYSVVGAAVLGHWAALMHSTFAEQD